MMHAKVFVRNKQQKTCPYALSFARLRASFGLLNRPVCKDLNDWNVWNGAIPMSNGAPVLCVAKRSRREAVKREIPLMVS